MQMNAFQISIDYRMPFLLRTLIDPYSSLLNPRRLDIIINLSSKFLQRILHYSIIHTGAAKF